MHFILDDNKVTTKSHDLILHLHICVKKGTIRLLLLLLFCMCAFYIEVNVYQNLVNNVFIMKHGNN